QERPRGRNHPYYRVPMGRLQLKVGTAIEKRSPLRAKSEGRLGTWKEARLLDDPCHDPVPADGHQVHASDPIDFPKGLDRPHGDAHALGLRIRRLLHAVHDVFRDRGPERLDQEARHLGRPQGDDPREDVDLLVEPFLPDKAHPFLERVDVVDGLRLDEIRAGEDLRAQLCERLLLGPAERIRRSPIVAAAREERRTRARVQSVTLQASTAPRYRETISRMSVGSAEAGGAISAVTAKMPDASIRSRWLPDWTVRTPTASAIGRRKAPDAI